MRGGVIMDLYRKLQIIVYSTILIGFMAGCDQVRDEFGTSEGFVGPQADRLLDARSQYQRADRYAMAMMMLVPMALETAGDAGETRATIQRTNELYASMATLYGAINRCTPGARLPSNTNAAVGPVNCRFHSSVDIVETGYNFESLSYEVQSDLYFVGRTIITNMDLDTDVSDLISLRPAALTGVWEAIPDVFPAARRLAAGYRDGVVLFADAIATACPRPPGGAGGCSDLHHQLNQQFHAGEAEQFERRELFELLHRAGQASDNVTWRLEQPQFRAFVAHLDRSCRMVFARQIDGGIGDDLVNCAGEIDGLGGVDVVADASDQRISFLTVVGLR